MNTLPLDPSIAALADQAEAWLTVACQFAIMRGLTLSQFLAECLLIEQATSCGYLATASRANGAKHMAYCEGAVQPTEKAKPMTDGEKFGLHGKAAA
jgi:hypothetical protein